MWLNHCECAATVLFKTVTGKQVSIISYFQNAREDRNFCANIKVFDSESWNLSTFKKNSFVEYIVHFDFILDGMVVKYIFSNDRGLFIVPVEIKYELFFK